MGKWLFLVEANCKDQTQKARFDTWYDTVHIPDVLTGSPGFQGATRYLIAHPAPGRGGYLTVYEIETDDIDKTMESFRKNLQEKYALGRNSDLLDVVSRRLCKVV